MVIAWETRISHLGPWPPSTRVGPVHNHFFVSRRHAGQPHQEKSGVTLAIAKGFLDPGAGAYWTTSSARASSDCGIVRPSALAVLRFITSSNLVGCSTGRSAGRAPFKILSAYSAALRYISRLLAP